MNTAHQSAPPALPPGPTGTMLALPEPEETFEQAYAPFEQVVRNAFFFKHGWLELEKWEDYYQEGVIKLWQMWQLEPDMFKTRSKSYIIGAAMNCGHHVRADQRRDKHVAFSLNDTLETILDDTNASVEFALYMSSHTNPYKQADLRIDFEAAFGKTIADIEDHPNREMLLFILMRVMLGEDIHAIKDTLGIPRKQASNWRYEAMKRLKQNCQFLH